MGKECTGKYTFDLDSNMQRRLLKQIAQGMNYLHSRGFIHRDLKPANILSSEDTMHVKIADFGSASRTKENMTTNLGTPSYMAPELVADSRSTQLVEADLVDVYSFGVVMWTMFTRQKPYADLKSVNMFTMMNQIVDGLRPTVPKPEDYVRSDLFSKKLPTPGSDDDDGIVLGTPPSWPPLLLNLVTQCWHENPASRPRFAEIVETLNHEALFYGHEKLQTWKKQREEEKTKKRSTRRREAAQRRVAVAMAIATATVPVPVPETAAVAVAAAVAATVAVAPVAVAMAPAIATVAAMAVAVAVAVPVPVPVSAAAAAAAAATAAAAAASEAAAT